MSARRSLALATCLIAPVLMDSVACPIGQAHAAAPARCSRPVSPATSARLSESAEDRVRAAKERIEKRKERNKTRKK